MIAYEGTRHLRAFDTGGTMLWERGGRGGGPEEFLSMQALQPFTPDSFVVWDPLSTRLSIWSNGGGFGRTVRPSFGAVPLFGGQLGAGRSVFTVPRPLSRQGPAAWEPYTDSVEVVIVELDGLARDTIGGFPASRKVVADAGALGGPSSIQSPLLDGPALAITAHAGHVYIGFPDGSPVQVFDTAGQVVSRIALPVKPRPRPPEVAEAVVEEQLESASGMSREAYRRYLERFPQPERYPAYDLLLVDSRGDLWVRTYPGRDDDLARWTVVNPAGEVVETHRWSVRFEPLEIGGDWILGTWRGEDDVEMVVMFGLDALP